MARTTQKIADDIAADVEAEATACSGEFDRRKVFSFLGRDSTLSRGYNYLYDMVMSSEMEALYLCSVFVYGVMTQERSGLALGPIIARKTGVEFVALSYGFSYVIGKVKDMSAFDTYVPTSIGSEFTEDSVKTRLTKVSEQLSSVMSEARASVLPNVKTLKTMVDDPSILLAKRKLAKLLGFMAFLGKSFIPRDKLYFIHLFCKKVDRTRWEGMDIHTFVSEVLGMVIEILETSDSAFSPGDPIFSYVQHEQACNWLLNKSTWVVPDNDVATSDSIPYSEWVAVYNQAKTFHFKQTQDNDADSATRYSLAWAGQRQRLVDDKFQELEKRDPPRVPPLNICLQGGSRTGKTSTLAPLIARAALPILMDRPSMSVKEVEGRTVAINMLDEYMSTYKPQLHKVAVIDEIGTMKEDNPKAASITAQFTSILGENVMPVNKAAVQDKGNVFFSTFLNICVTNVEGMGLHGLEDMSKVAVYRRFEYPPIKRSRTDPGTLYFDVLVWDDETGTYVDSTADFSFPELQFDDMTGDLSVEEWRGRLFDSLKHLRFVPRYVEGIKPKLVSREDGILNIREFLEVVVTAAHQKKEMNRNFKNKVQNILRTMPTEMLRMDKPAGSCRSVASSVVFTGLDKHIMTHGVVNVKPTSGETAPVPH
jgi:hypothetical protein